MKKITMLLLLAVTSTFAFSQDEKNYEDNEIRTIFSKHKGTGAYGAFSFGYSQIDGKEAFISGARAAFILNHSLAIGVGGYGFVNDLDYKDIINDQPVSVGLAGGYGGLIIEPIIASRFPVHVSFPVLIGIGGVSLVEENDWWDHYYQYNTNEDVFLVLEPSAELELNLAKFFRLAAFVSYRFTTDVEIEGTRPGVMDGWNVGMTFKLGKF
jgi:hypothetical protein